MFLRPLKPELRPVLDRVAEAEHILLLLDFDGTLTHLESDRNAVQLPALVRESLLLLEKDPKFTVGFISGRSLDDLVTRIGLVNVVYSGNQGNEIRGRGLGFVEPFSYMTQPALNELLATVTPRLQGLPNVKIENKRLTATVHLRGARPDDRAEATKIMLSAVKEFDRFFARRGRDAIEILPQNGWHKGTAVQWIRQNLNLGHALVIYAGDDECDEDVFATFPDEITVKIGDGPTQAMYAADSPIEVWALLTQLSGACSEAQTASAPRA